MRLKPVGEQVVVLFGASSGIGREAALRFAERGAKVVVAARSADGLESLAQEIRSAGGEATGVAADVTDFGQVQAVADLAADRYGRVDTWVHLAGVALYATFADTTLEEFRQLVEVNLMGQVHGAKAALPHLMRAGGAFISITSVEARRSLPYHSAYAAAKHGVNGFLEALRMELRYAEAPVVITEIMPASINTPLFNKGRTKLGVKPMPLPPIYPPSLVADAILHAAQHPTRELVVGGSGQTMVLGQRLSPSMMDALFTRPGFELQRTDEPKSEDEPHNLFEPIQGQDRIEGDFIKQARLMGDGNWVLRDRTARWALTGLMLGAAGYLLSGARKAGQGG